MEGFFEIMKDFFEKRFILTAFAIICVHLSQFGLKLISKKVAFLKKQWVRFYLSIPIGLVIFVIIASLIDKYIITTT